MKRMSDFRINRIFWEEQKVPKLCPVTGYRRPLEAEKVSLDCLFSALIKARILRSNRVFSSSIDTKMPFPIYCSVWQKNLMKRKIILQA